MPVGKIVVVNKYAHKGPYTYIGRGSVLGNPYPISMGRVKCIEKFKAHAAKDTAKEGPIYHAMFKLVQRVLDGETVYLGCFCKPKACHGDEIKKCVDFVVTAKTWQTDEAEVAAQKGGII